jgi:GNAT superfamily N-acetyltransferase
MTTSSEADAAWSIRPVAQDDFESWLSLWNDYLHFYRAKVPESVSRLTFERVCASDHDIFGLVAESRRELLGFAHGLLHPSTWSAAPSCYLEDLFVAPAARGRGTARALIEAAANEATRRHAAKIYWHTQEFNGPARSLYDQLASRISFVVYERQLDREVRPR